MAGAVDATSIPAEAEPRPGIRAIAQPEAEVIALGGRRVHLDGHATILGIAFFGFHDDARKIAAGAEGGLEIGQPVRVVRIPRIDFHVTLDEVRIEYVLLDRDRTEIIAWPARQH